MNFQIRSNDANDKDYMAKFEEYQNYLKRFNMNEHRDLWSFFAADFFHDGRIEGLQFSVDIQSMVFKVSCPNIKRNDVNSWSYIKPVWFTCKFEGVTYFQMEAQKIDEDNDPLLANEKYVRFLESEINTLTEKIEKYNNIYKDEFFSIIIKTLPIQRDFSLIFRTLKVTPIEPLAFEIIKQDKNYEIPLFTR
jgi:frataxin-like iron-binding protein CyaY